MLGMVTYVCESFLSLLPINMVLHATLEIHQYMRRHIGEHLQQSFLIWKKKSPLSISITQSKRMVRIHLNPIIHHIYHTTCVVSNCIRVQKA